MAFFNVLSEKLSTDDYTDKDNFADANTEINDEVCDKIYGLEEQSASVSVACNNPKNLPSARFRPLTVHASNIGGRSLQGLVSYNATKKVTRRATSSARRCKSASVMRAVSITIDDMDSERGLASSASSGSGSESERGRLATDYSENEEEKEEGKETRASDVHHAHVVLSKLAYHVDAGDQQGCNNTNNLLSDAGWDTDLESDEDEGDFVGSLKSKYLEACKTTGIIPATYFLRHMTDEVLNMKHHGLAALGTKAICVALSSNTHIMQLNLADNWLGEEGGVAICNMLRENCYIHKIDLSDNKLGVNFARKFVEVVECNAALTHVNLSGNDFDESTAEFLAATIHLTSRIEVLKLSKNKLAEKAGVLLGPALADNASIRYLDLSWNSIRRKGAAALAHSLKTNMFLQKLNLSWNGIGNDGARVLGEALKTNTALIELDISNNHITAEGAGLFSKGLVINESLKILKIGKNPLQSVGSCAVLGALLKNNNTLIELIDFSDLTLGRECTELLSRLRERLPTVKLLEGAGSGPMRPRVRVHPMVKLRNYIEKHNLRLVDFFNKFDTDHSMSVTHEEFMTGIEQTGIKLTEAEIQQLIKELDKDGDGEINYSELVMGHQNFAEEEKKLASALTSMRVRDMP